MLLDRHYATIIFLYSIKIMDITDYWDGNNNVRN